MISIVTFPIAPVAKSPDPVSKPENLAAAYFRNHVVRMFDARTLSPKPYMPTGP